MISTTFITAVLAAASLASAAPSLAARQSTVCGSTPKVSIGSKIELISSDGSLGYLASSPNDYQGFGYTDDPSQALTGIFTCGSPTSRVVMSADNAPAYDASGVNAIGLVAPFSDGTPNVGPGNSNFLSMFPSPVSAVGATPQDGEFTAGDLSWESAVWTVSNNVLTPYWVNEDGSLHELLVATNPAGTTVITGDWDAFLATWGYINAWVQVTLQLTD